MRPLQHEPTRSILEAERAFASGLGASCQSPIAGHATLANGILHLAGLVGSADGQTILTDEISGAVAEAAKLGGELAGRLLEVGAAKFL